MKKCTWYLAMFLVSIVVTGCGSVDSAVANEQVAPSAIPAKTAGSQQATPTIDPAIIRVKVGETITIPVVIEPEETFSGFQAGIGSDSSKVEVVSAASLLEGAGFFACNLKYEPNPKDINLFEYWQENVKMGLSKTTFVVGVTTSEISGKVNLFSVTIKGAEKGKTILNVKMNPGALANKKYEFVKVPEIKPIQILVE